ncbi:tRNA threonylcarbamoyladenosine biosynthesis protein TsaB [Pirellula sp. SH-Sr6A]|uniref:tRNA (adenosine(37)-N6)-threonylcarbamoyltransferase complex dimerization subunit type 1 TsaB n=1 Tax=Pirellula sp. SH-Sr6A TaxID=1632865 RepID=UPI00078B9C31|nr:tRNA (adenosine(37)-N6)-threonylcarbamoyltransferase complex dimerization subunit type 1 TsaB [Pirellula sp. SH-Sr6A]AMV33060.1 tRNA threonylcarbamoyladenosine biosynthesis protein TsaB [Pirellula sp. SH-Sr6A]
MSVLLALETSGKSGSVAIIDRSGDPASVQSAVLPDDIGSGQSLAPAIRRLLDQNGLATSQIGCMALLTGPGSFTGLRVGVATAKAMAYGLGCPIVELDTLDAIHRQCDELDPDPSRWTHVLLDAFRGQLFWKGWGPDGSTPPSGTQAIDIEEFLMALQRVGVSEQHRLAGPGCERLRRFLANEEDMDKWGEWLTGVHWLEDIRFSPQAATVAKMGWEKWVRGEFTELFALLPHYYRGSAAEEKKKKLS